MKLDNFSKTDLVTLIKSLDQEHPYIFWISKDKELYAQCLSDTNYTPIGFQKNTKGLKIRFETFHSLSNLLEDEVLLYDFYKIIQFMKDYPVEGPFYVDNFHVDDYR